MKSKRGLVAGGMTLGLVTLACAVSAQTAAPNVIRQNMPIVALQNGHFQESLTIGEAKAQGDLGIGAMASLDGEVINVDGTIYQFGSDGVVRVPPDDARLSFSAMTLLRASRPPIQLPAGTSLACLGPVLDPLLPTLNSFYAVRIRGTFSSATARTFPRQQPPFTPLCKVPQTIFPPFTNVRGTMVGYRSPGSPRYLENVALADYHLHFLNNAKDGGGHVLDFIVTDATVEIELLDNLVLDFPKDRAFAEMDLSEPITCSPPPSTPTPPVCPPLPPVRPASDQDSSPELVSGKDMVVQDTAARSSCYDHEKTPISRRSRLECQYTLYKSVQR